MNKIFKVIAIVLICICFFLFVEAYPQSNSLSEKLEYKAEELLRQTDYLQRETSSYIASPDWNEEKLFKKIGELKENSEQLYRLSGDYYSNESQIFALLGEFNWQLQEILAMMNRHGTLRILTKDCVRCKELIDEYNRIILETLLSELKEQFSDFMAEIENWINKENKDQLKILNNIQQFEKSCQNIDNELHSYYFDFQRVKKLVFELYNLSSKLKQDLKRHKTTNSIERKWDICTRLLENLKNTTQSLESKSYWEKEVMEEANNPPVGFLDIVSRSEISGWAFDIDAGIKPIYVHIYINQHHVATVLANEKREDLMGKVPGLKEPYHGFRWKPDNLSPGRHLVKVYAINLPEGENPLLGQKIIY